LNKDIVRCLYLHDNRPWQVFLLRYNSAIAADVHYAGHTGGNYIEAAASLFSRCSSLNIIYDRCIKPHWKKIKF